MMSARSAARFPRVVEPRRYDSTRASRLGLGSAILLVFGALLFSLVLGLGAATGNKLVIIAMAGLLGGVAVLAMPVKATFWVMLVSAFALVGPLTYFARLSQVQWLPALLGIAVTLQVLMLAITRRRTQDPSVAAPAFVLWLALFFLCVVFSSVVGKVSIPEVIMASRYYLFIWGALFVFLVGAIDDKTIERLWYALLFIAALQMPMALYQYLFVAKQRAQVVGGPPPWDAVIGTFPGNDTGGGNSAAMAIYLVVMIVLAIAMWQQRHLRWFKSLAVIGLALLAILLAEVKAAVLLLPVAVGIYYRREIIRRPVEAIAALSIAVVVAGGILYGYQKLHYDKGASSAAAAFSHAEASTLEHILYQFDPDRENERTGRLARAANLKQWWDLNVASGDLHHLMIGYGMGTTQHSNIGVGSVAAKYGMDIDRTTFVILVWELGLIGLLMFLGLLTSSAWLSMKLANDKRIPDRHRLLLRVGSIGLFIFLITVPYKSFAVRLTSIQLLIILMMGQAYYWYHRLKVEELRTRLQGMRSSVGIAR